MALGEQDALVALSDRLYEAGGEIGLHSGDPIEEQYGTPDDEYPTYEEVTSGEFAAPSFQNFTDNTRETVEVSFSAAEAAGNIAGSGRRIQLLVYLVGAAVLAYLFGQLFTFEI